LLEVAAVRVLESRAQLALASGLKYPQLQALGGDAPYDSSAQSDILDLLNYQNVVLAASRANIQMAQANYDKTSQDFQRMKGIREEDPGALSERRVESAESRKTAMHAMVIVFPVALFILFSPNSPSYIVLMINLASMDQQASTEQSRRLGISRLESTLWGGAGAVIGWQLLALWPSLIFFSLLMALACLLYDRGIFQGPALHPKAQMWSYALVVLLVPAVSNSLAGSDASGL
jgi:hypothetical protein